MTDQQTIWDFPDFFIILLYKTCVSSLTLNAIPRHFRRKCFTWRNLFIILIHVPCDITEKSEITLYRRTTTFRSLVIGSVQIPSISDWMAVSSSRIMSEYFNSMLQVSPLKIIARVKSGEMDDQTILPQIVQDTRLTRLSFKTP